MTNKDAGLGGHISLTGLSEDLYLILGVSTLLWLVTLVPILNETPLRIIVAVPFVLFIPGYALIAALFPEAGTVATGEQSPADDGSGTPSGDGISLLERAVFSFGSSIGLVPLIGLLLNFTPWGIRLLTILAALTILTGLLILVAAERRARLPAHERFDPAIVRTVQAHASQVTSAENSGELLVNIVLVLGICIAAGSVGYAITVQPDGEPFTEFYLLTENETGDLVAGGYPTNMTVGEDQQIVVGIGNHEDRPLNYTVVIELQDVHVDGNQTVVTTSEELDRFTRHLQPNETIHSQRQLRPTELTGQRLRLQFRLYRGYVPSGDDRTDPYRETHLWVNVSTGGTT